MRLFFLIVFCCILVAPLADSKNPGIDIPELSYAVRVQDTIYAATKNEIKVIDKKLKIQKTITFENNVEYITAFADKLYILFEDETIQIQTLSTSGCSTPTIGSMGRSAGIVVINEKVIAIVHPGRHVEFRSFPENKSINKVRWTGMIYDPMDAHIVGNMMYLPGAYPGEVIVINIDNYQLEKRVSVLDWIHAVKVMGDSVFVAGHLGGISMCSWQEFSKPEKKAEIEVINKDTHASLYAKDKRLFAVIKEGVIELSPSDGKVIKKATTVLEDREHNYILDVEDNTVFLVVANKGILLINLNN